MTQNPQPTSNQRQLLPEPTLRRLPWYLAYVSMLKAQGVEYVSSTTISRKLNVDASQIAKDLSFINIKGKTRIGYEVNTLERTLRDFLGFKTQHNAVIIGVGSLGSALMADSGLNRYGLNIVAGFDNNPDLIGSHPGGVRVYPIEKLGEIVPRFNVEIGIITVPAESAQEVADKLVESGVKALWNFTPFRIRTNDDTVIANTSIYAHLAVMYNRLSLINSSNTAGQ